MSIRNVEQSKVPKTQEISRQAPPAPSGAKALQGLRDLVDRALKDGNFSESELNALVAGIRANPGLQGQVVDHLKAALEKAAADNSPVAISEKALSKVSQTLGVDFKALFFRRQATSRKVDHDVAGGLEKQAMTVADEHSVEKHKAASDTRLATQRAILDSKKGVVGRPIGGSKGAAYDAALVLAKSAEEKLDAKLAEKWPETKAAKDVLREPLVRTANAVIVEAGKNPETMKSISDAVGALGQEGFKEALGSAASQVGKHIVAVTGMNVVNGDALASVLSGTTVAVDKGVKLAKSLNNPTLEAGVRKLAPKVTESMASIGAKLAASSKVVGTAANTASAAKTAAQVGTAAAETAQVAGAGAKAAGQAVPIVSTGLGVVSTGMAAAEVAHRWKQEPRSLLRVAVAGVNTLLQGLGVVVPFVGAASTLGKHAIDKALDARDKKNGVEVTGGFQLADATPHLNNASALAGLFLDSAGHGDISQKLRVVTDQVNVLADKGVTSEGLAALSAAEREALMQQLGSAHGYMEQAAVEAKGKPEGAAAVLAGEGMRTIVSVLRKLKNVDKAEDPEAERKKLLGEAMEAAGKATAAQAILAGAEEKAA